MRTLSYMTSCVTETGRGQTVHSVFAWWLVLIDLQWVEWYEDVCAECCHNLMLLTVLLKGSDVPTKFMRSVFVIICCRCQQAPECGYMSAVQPALRRDVVRRWDGEDLGSADRWFPAESRSARQWGQRRCCVAYPLQQHETRLCRRQP